MSTAIEDRRSAAPPDIETVFAGLLAEVLHVDRVSVDSHFFDQLGADSLVMARFCARVRKRGHLPSVSMKDVYAHPTIRSLAVALEDAAPSSGQRAAATTLEAPTPTSAREYVLCGALQALFYLGYSHLGVLAGIEGYEWLVAGSEGVLTYLRLVLLSGAAFLVVCAVPVAAKWLLIGRWKPQELRIWSLAYVRFWIVKTLIRSNPGVYLFVGSPLYGVYLRALGAKVGRGVVILSKHIPVCTDLLTIGAGTVIRRESSFYCYRAQAGRIEIGPVTLGRDAFVGEMSVLDIHTSMGDGAQLGHASSLHRGQSVPACERWHGSPARSTDTNYLRVAPARCGRLRRARYAAGTLICLLFLYAPLLELGFGLLFHEVSSLVRALDPGVQSGTGALTVRGLLIEALAFSVVLFFGGLLVGLLAVGTLPRLLSVFVKPDTVYPLYGFRYSVHRAIAGLGRLRFFPLLFGDSSYIVPFLSWVGYRLSPVVQTGSNFGSEVTTSNPVLTSVGSGTMAADGLNIITDEVSSTSFRVSRTAIGSRNFLGNYVNYPSGGRTGDNCLLATKVMVPLDGEIREGVGLLGSPPFEIPRSVERDSRYDHLRKGEALARGLAAKNRFNLQTIGIFLATVSWPVPGRAHRSCSHRVLRGRTCACGHGPALRGERRRRRGLLRPGGAWLRGARPAAAEDLLHLRRRLLVGRARLEAASDQLPPHLRRHAVQEPALAADRCPDGQAGLRRRRLHLRADPDRHRGRVCSQFPKRHPMRIAGGRHVQVRPEHDRRSLHDRGWRLRPLRRDDG